MVKKKQSKLYGILSFFKFLILRSIFSAPNCLPFIFSLRRAKNETTTSNNIANTSRKITHNSRPNPSCGSEFYAALIHRETKWLSALWRQSGKWCNIPLPNFFTDNHSRALSHFSSSRQNCFFKSKNIISNKHGARQRNFIISPGPNPCCFLISRRFSNLNGLTKNRFFMAQGCFHQNFPGRFFLGKFFRGGAALRKIPRGEKNRFNW